MKSIALMSLAMAAMSAPQPTGLVNNEMRMDTYRPYVGGFDYFRGMTIGGNKKHFNKKRHGKMLRRKHKRS